MDKYETGLRIQEIRNAYEDKNFIKAAELAKDVDWSKIKEWIPLAMMVDVQEQVGDLDWTSIRISRVCCASTPRIIAC